MSKPWRTYALIQKQSIAHYFWYPLWSYKLFQSISNFCIWSVNINLLVRLRYDTKNKCSKSQQSCWPHSNCWNWQINNGRQQNMEIKNILLKVLSAKLEHTIIKISPPLECLSSTHDLDLGSGHTAYRRAPVIDLYLQTKFHWNQKKLFRGRTNRRDPSKFKVTWHKKVGQM